MEMQYVTEQIKTLFQFVALRTAILTFQEC